MGEGEYKQRGTTGHERRSEGRPRLPRNGNEHQPRCTCEHTSLVRMLFAVLHYCKSDLLIILHPFQSNRDSRHVQCLLERQLSTLWTAVSFPPWISTAATTVKFSERFWLLGPSRYRSMVKRKGCISPTNRDATPSTTDHRSEPSFHTSGSKHTGH